MQNSVIIGIFFKLMSRRKITMSKLAEFYDVSVRTIFRYLDVLETAGVPIIRETGKNGGVSIDEDYRLERTFFTKEERLRVVNSLRLTSIQFGDELSASALDKLMTQDGDKDEDYFVFGEHLVIDATGWDKPDAYRHKLGTITRAIRDNELIVISYTGGTTNDTSERPVEPHTLVLKEGEFYLYAFCRLRGDFRTFKLSRINSIQAGGEIFVRKEIAGAPWQEAFRQSLSK